MQSNPLPLLGLVTVAGLVMPGPAAAIPAFARKYKVSCALCHNPIPKLTAFGEQFAANGFRFASNEAPRDTINTGDPLLQLANQFPLAMRLEAYAQWYLGGLAATDSETPYGLKIMSSGTTSKTMPAGFGRAERRNFRWTLEATYDLTQETLRWGLGFVTAF